MGKYFSEDLFLVGCPFSGDADFIAVDQTNFDFHAFEY
jgi:hypothetical protein